MKKKTAIVKKPSGRPSKYKPQYCEEIITFFNGPKNKQVIKSEKTITKSNGTTETFKEYMWIAEDLPTLNKFARSIGVTHDTLLEWAKPINKNKYPNFSVSYNTAKELQKEFLTDNGLKGLYPPASFIFVSKNVTDMKDEQKVDHTSKGKRIEGFNYVKPNGINKADNKTNTEATPSV